MLMKIILGALLGNAILTCAADPTPQQREKIQRLENAVLAPCCYSETVSRHNSEVAIKMRAEIAAWVLEGKSAREILDTYKSRYGLRVLAEPEGLTWWWLTPVPWVVLIFGFFQAVRILRKWSRAPRRSSAPPPPRTLSLPVIEDE